METPLRTARIKHRLTLDIVAAATGISKTYLHQLEVGKSTDISLSLARKLSNYYGIHINKLFPKESPCT